MFSATLTAAFNFCSSPRDFFHTIRDITNPRDFFCFCFCATATFYTRDIYTNKEYEKLAFLLQPFKASFCRFKAWGAAVLRLEPILPVK